jgi:P4 family phage/plasmid primase-like protien
LILSNKNVSRKEPRITEAAALAAKGHDAYSPFFEVTPETGNALQDTANVKQLAQLKHTDPPRFFDLIDVLTDRGVRRLPDLSRKVDGYLKRQADATKRKSAVALPRLNEIDQDTESYYGEITITKGGDVANGKAFAERYRGRLLYVDAAQEWRRFNGNHWEKCSQSNIDSAAKSCLRVIINDCTERLKRDPGDKVAHQELNKAVSAYDRLAKVRAVAESGRSERGMFVNDPDRFDKDLWHLGVQNGVIDLRTGRLLPPDPGLLISKIAGTEYHEDAECPLWLETLDAIFQGDAELIDFVQRAAGYTLCGDVSEEVCFFLYGAGANGKSTFMMVLQGVLGEYVGTLSSKVVTRSRGNETEVRLAKAGAVGRRLIWSNETKESDVFDDDVLKAFSSRDPIPDARWHHQHPFAFTPTHTLWMRGNHKPGVRDSSHSFWRRLIPIIFKAKFEGAAIKHNLDKRILAAERVALDGRGLFEVAAGQPPHRSGQH